MKHACVLCDKDLEPVNPDKPEALQPYEGGEIRFVFAYGSTKFDHFPGSTHFKGLICDDCGEPLVKKMKRTGYDMDGELLKAPDGERWKPTEMSEEVFNALKKELEDMDKEASAALDQLIDESEIE